MTAEELPGTLRIGEPHPASHDAYRYVNDLSFDRKSILMASFSSCALSGNRSSEIAAETLRRVMHGEPVSDRYVLGLAWQIKSLNSEI